MNKNIIAVVFSTLALVSCDYYKNHEVPFEDCEKNLSASINSPNIDNKDIMKKPGKANDNIMIAGNSECSKSK